MEKIYLVLTLFFAAMALRKAGLIRPKHSAFITDFVIKISLPCLSVVTLSRAQLESQYLATAVVAWSVILAGAAAAFIIGRLTAIPDASLRSFVLVSAFPNTGFLGYPITYALFGGAGLSYAVVYDQIGMFPLFLSVGFLIAGGREGMGKVLVYPPFIALLTGLGLNALDLELPGPINTIFSAIGWTTLPLTIFLIGAKITFKPTGQLKLVAAALGIRMLLIPAILFAVYSFAGISGLAASVSILESAMPPALSTSILTVERKLDEDLAVTTIGAGTLLFIVGLALFMAFT